MKKIALLAAATAAVIATPALAHTGPYVGIIGGYDSVSLDLGNESESKGDVMYGIIAGYDVHMDSGLVLGVEAELSDSEVSQRYSGDAIKAGHDIYAGVRAGFEAAEGTLIYAKGGYTNARVKVETGSLNISEGQSGFRLGAGAEQQFQGFAVRLEYRYSEYGDVRFDDLSSGVDMSRHQVVAGVLAKF
ncbi:outer membrane beta-barrel protein [Altererythrobacter xixiisoli]|uniref:Outer membrane beta-barrel protein n=1 Tax=Croceibacterium xixiisoli TaxID=1476466 RepID=A0A6I4TRI5_9SPHN|nr:outer membrane beta-barrel protein [Croceibacterium xixiisoli]MXO97919.1 outer membrane beta-barrel protein [Croceibacterium xixiisoli]